MSGVVNICDALLVVVLPVGVLCGTVYTTVSFVLYTSIPGVHSSSIVREVQCTILVLIMRSILVACYVEEWCAVVQ